MVKFGSARISENGTANGQRGDSTGYEVCEQQAYWHKNGWRGIRAKNPTVANGIAFTMACACRSDVVGYSQVQDGGRYLIFWTDLREDVLTNADCSTLVPFCVIKAGVNVNVDGIWTGNLIERLMETGEFETFEVYDLEKLKTGDILVDGKLTSHTVVVTEGISRLEGNFYDAPEPTLQWGSQGTEVRKLQGFLNEYANAGIAVDGDFKGETKKALRFFQGVCGQATDGIYGQNSYAAVVFCLGLLNVQAV